MIDRLLSAFWVPVVSILATAVLIVAVGELLLYFGHMEKIIGDVREPYAVVAGTVLTVLVMLGAAVLSRSSSRS